MIDYKLLLIKYIAIVSSAEGVDFISREGASDEGITSVEENNELRKLSKDSGDYWEAPRFLFKESSIT